MDITQFWHRVKTMAKINNLTLVYISESLGYNSKYINILSSRNSIPDIELVSKLASMLGVSCDYLINGDESNSSLPQQKQDIIDQFFNLPADRQNVIKTLINFLSK